MLTIKDLQADGWEIVKQVAFKVELRKDGWVAHGNLSAGTFALFDPTGIQRPVPDEIPKIWAGKQWYCISCFGEYDGKGITQGMHTACYNEERDCLL